jgi:hypothetical protein
MIFQDLTGDLQTLEQIFTYILPYISAILNFLLPFLIPVGSWMITMTSGIMNALPGIGNENTYFLIALTIIVVGVIVNFHWDGETKQSALNNIDNNAGPPKAPISGILNDKKEENSSSNSDEHF